VWFFGRLECSIVAPALVPFRRYLFARSLYPAAFCALLLCGGLAQAQPPARGLGVGLEAGALFGGAASLDSGGDLTVDNWSVRLSGRRPIGDDLRLGLAAGFGEQRYRFSGVGDFSSLRPWGTAREVRLSGSVFWQPTDRWDLFAIPTVRWNAEDGASLDDGQIAGLLTAASYRFSDRLSIGPGVGVFSELEDDTDFFPILAIDWRITDRLSFNTGRGFAASRRLASTASGRALLAPARYRASQAIRSRARATMVVCGARARIRVVAVTAAWALSMVSTTSSA
jgi:hypothetical protein